MIKLYNKLQFRLTVSFVILILIIASFSYFYTYTAAKNAIKQTVTEELVTITNMVASQIDKDKLDKILSFKQGQDNDKEYLDIVNFLYKFREKDKDIDNFYIMQKNGEKITFLLDDYIVVDPNDTAFIEEEYTDYEDELLEAFEGKTTYSKEFYKDKWGTFLSAYVPIKDAQGNVRIVLGTDMLVSKAVEKQEFIGSLIYVVMGLAIFAAALIIFFFSTTIIRDINALTKVAQKLSLGELDFELPTIKSKNEIHQLNNALMSVLAAIEFLKDAAEDKFLESETANDSPVEVETEESKEGE